MIDLKQSAIFPDRGVLKVDPHHAALLTVAEMRVLSTELLILANRIEGVE